MAQRIHYQKGVTLAEFALTMAVLGGLMSVLLAMVNQDTDKARAITAGTHTGLVLKAAQAYINDNPATVLAGATSTTPHKITIATLKTGGYLPSNFSATNGYGQTACVLALEPTANNIEAMVVTEGGTAIPEIPLRVAANELGASGGSVPQSTPTTIVGAGGAWSRTLSPYNTDSCSGTPVSGGHFAATLYFENAVTSGGAPYLHRSSVSGHPELNTMSTDLNMGTFKITNAGSIALNTVVTANAACTTNGEIARDTNGAVMSCQSGQWKSQGSSYWQDPVNTFASLPACNAAAVGQTRAVMAPSVGSGVRAYTCNGAGTWQPLGKDDSANLTAEGRVTGATLYPSATVTEGVACSNNGDIAKDSTGLILSCQSGVWAKVMSANSGYNMTTGLQIGACEGAIAQTLSCGDGCTESYGDSVRFLFKKVGSNYYYRVRHASDVGYDSGYMLVGTSYINSPFIYKATCSGGTCSGIGKFDSIWFGTDQLLCKAEVIAS